MADDVFGSLPDLPQQVDFSALSTALTDVQLAVQFDDEDDLFAVGPVPDHLVAQYFERRSIKIEVETRRRHDDERQASEQYIARLEARSASIRSRSGADWPSLPPDMLAQLQPCDEDDDDANSQLRRIDEVEATGLLSGEIDDDVRQQYQLLSAFAGQHSSSSGSSSDDDFADSPASSSSVDSASASALSIESVEQAADDEEPFGYEPLDDCDRNNAADDSDSSDEAESVGPDSAA